MLTVLEKVSLLQSTPLFSDVPTHSLARIASVAREIPCEARHALFREDHPAEAMFYLLQGGVEIRDAGGLVEKLVTPGLIGELPVLLEESYTHSAITTEPSRVLRLDGQELFEAMEEDFGIARGIVRVLARRAAGIAMASRPSPTI